MMGLTSHLSIFLCLEACDMRKSYNGLAALADRLAPDGLKSGALFLFTNKRRNRFQALYYDRTGVCIWRIQAASAIGLVGRKMSLGVWKSRHFRGLRFSLS